MDGDDIRREDLNDLLVTCRGRIDPLDVHLGGRGPGLSQNEVAALAGVSTRWYASLERGEHKAPLPHMLDSVRDALHMTEAERERLYLLAVPRSRPTTTPIRYDGPGWGTCNERHKDILGRTAPHAAAVLDQAMTVVEASPGFRAWLGQRDAQDKVVNALVWCFGEAAAARFPDVGALRDTAVAHARDIKVRRPGDPHVAAILDKLVTLPGVGPHWHSQDTGLLAPVCAHKAIDPHGELMELVCAITQLDDGWRLLVLYTPTVPTGAPDTPEGSAPRS